MSGARREPRRGSTGSRGAPLPRVAAALACLAAWCGGCATEPASGWLSSGRLGDGARWQMRGATGQLWTVEVRAGDLGLSIGDASLWLVGADPGSGVPFAVLDLGEPRLTFTLPDGRAAEWRGDALTLGELRYRLAPGAPPPAIDVSGT